MKSFLHFFSAQNIFQSLINNNIIVSWLCVEEELLSSMEKQTKLLKLIRCESLYHGRYRNGSEKVYFHTDIKKKVVEMVEI